MLRNISLYQLYYGLHGSTVFNQLKPIQLSQPVPMHPACGTMDVNYVSIVSAPSDEAHNALDWEAKGNLREGLSQTCSVYRWFTMLQACPENGLKRAVFIATALMINRFFRLTWIWTLGNGETTELPPRHVWNDSLVSQATWKGRRIHCNMVEVTYVSTRRRNKKTINHQGYVFFKTICATYVFTGSALFLDFFGLSLTIEFEDSFPNHSWCDSKSHHQAEFCRFDLTAWNKYIWPLNQQTCVATSFEMALHDVYSFQEN